MAGGWPAGLFHHRGNSQQWNPDKLTEPFFHPRYYEKHLLGGLAGDRAAEIPQLSLQRFPCELLQGTWLIRPRGVEGSLAYKLVPGRKGIRVAAGSLLLMVQGQSGRSPAPYVTDVIETGKYVGLSSRK